MATGDRKFTQQVKERGLGMERSVRLQDARCPGQSSVSRCDSHGTSDDMRSSTIADVEDSMGFLESCREPVSG